MIQKEKLFGLPFKFQPTGQKEASKKSHRNFVLNKIKSEMVKGNTSIALKNVHNWNRANPLYQITYEDINHKKLYDFILRKYEKRANP